MCEILILFVVVYLSFRVNEVIIHWGCVISVVVHSVLSFCSWFCCNGGFVFHLSRCYSFIELVLRSVLFVICGLLRMRIVFWSCSFWPCRLFGIIVHLLFSHWMHMIWNLVRISVGVCSGHLLQNEICLLQSLFFFVDMDGFLNNVSRWIGDSFERIRLLCCSLGLSLFVCWGRYVER